MSKAQNYGSSQSGRKSRFQSIKEHQVTVIKPERSEDAENEEREVEMEKIEKKQTKKTASNFDRCCFGEWSRTLRRTEAT